LENNKSKTKGRKNKMNKKGMKTGGVVLVILVSLVALMLLGLGGYFLYNASQNVNVEGTTNPNLCGDSTGVLTVNAINKLDQGTAIAGETITAGVEDGSVVTSVTSGTTAFAIGSKVKVLVSNSSFIDESFDFVMPCGGYILQAPLYASASTNPGVRIKNDDGDFMSDAIAGLTTNQTSLSAGETVNLEVEFQGVNKESTGDLIYIVELPASTSANVTEINMAGATKVNTPSVHTLQNAGSKVQAFKIPAVIGADKKTYVLSIVLSSGKIISGGVYTDWYSEQEFIDTNGQLAKGVQDSSGTAKYENTGDSDFYINAP
jgi:hypothetical protein